MKQYGQHYQLLPHDHLLSTKHKSGNLIFFHFSIKRFLGEYPEEHFTEPAAQEAILSFQAHLKEISSIIHKRNKELEVPYAYLLPERVPNGVTI